MGDELRAAAERVAATIHRINGHWWNSRKRPEAPDLRLLIDAVKPAPTRPAERDAEVEALRSLLNDGCRAMGTAERVVWCIKVSQHLALPTSAQDSAEGVS